MVKTKLFKVKFKQAPTTENKGIIWRINFLDPCVYIVANNIVEASKYATENIKELASYVKLEDGYKIDGIYSVEEYCENVFAKPIEFYFLH